MIRCPIRGAVIAEFVLKRLITGVKKGSSLCSSAFTFSFGDTIGYAIVSERVELK